MSCKRIEDSGVDIVKTVELESKKAHGKRRHVACHAKPLEARSLWSRCIKCIQFRVDMLDAVTVSCFDATMHSDGY